MDAETQKRKEALDNALAILGEHYDHVQIMVTFSDSRGTAVNYRGIGNWYARQGMAHEFINNDIAQDNATQIAQKLKDKNDS